MTRRTRLPQVDTLSLTLSCVPVEVLDLIRTGHADILPTRLLNLFYAFADSIEKTIKALKEKCRVLIIARRDEGKPTGAENQHREFVYPGVVRLTVQERIAQEPDPEKLEALLQSKDLWQSALTTTLDMEKVDGLCLAGLITTEELASVSDTPKATYALIVKWEPNP